jgi:hypothetical protein
LIDNKTENTLYNDDNDALDSFKWVKHEDNTNIGDNLYPNVIYSSTVGDPPNDGGNDSAFSMIKFTTNSYITLYLKQSSEFRYDYVSVYVGQNGDNKLKVMLDMNNTTPPPFPSTIISNGLDLTTLPPKPPDGGVAPDGPNEWYYIDIDNNMDVIIVFAKDSSRDLGDDKGYFYFNFN